MPEIQYNTEQLLEQSQQLSSLQADYDALFARVASALNGLNESWSENLARNFAGKIQSAQKSFGSIVNMLANGAAAAKLGATSHSPTSIESFFSSLDGYVGDAGGLSGVSKELSEALGPMSNEEKLEALRKMDDFLAGTYDELPDKVKYLLDRYTPSSVKDSIAIYRDLIQGEQDGDTVGKVWNLASHLPVVGKPVSLLGKVGQDIYNTVDGYRKEGYYAQGDALLDKGYDAFQDGKTLEGVVYYTEGAASYLNTGVTKLSEELGLKDATDFIGDKISDILDWAGVSDKQVSEIGSLFGF